MNHSVLLWTKTIRSQLVKMTQSLTRDFINNTPVISWVLITEPSVVVTFHQQMHGQQHLSLPASGATRICCSCCCYGQQQRWLLLPLWMASMPADPPAWCLLQNVFPAPVVTCTVAIVLWRGRRERSFFYFCAQNVSWLIGLALC